MVSSMANTGLSALSVQATHIGSLLRPPQLLAKRAEFLGGKCTAEELRQVEDEAIKDVVKMQRALGMKEVTDGEYRRSLYFEGIFECLEGMTFLPQAPLNEMELYVPFVNQLLAGGMTTWPSFFCSGKIRRPSSGIYTSQFKFLKSLLPADEVKHAKITVCPPEWMHVRYRDRAYDKSVYANDDEYFADLTKAYREEIKALYDLGCRNIQMDAATFCFFIHPSMEAGLTEKGLSADAVIAQYIQVINDCFRDVRHPSEGQPDMSDMTVGVHLCRGNFRGMHFIEGGYDRIAQKLFEELDVNRFYLEYDTPRAGSFECLKHLPQDKTVVLGLVSTKVSKLEDTAFLKERVNEAAEWICKGDARRTKEEALAQLRLSPQCGFASTMDGNPITEEDEKNKLALVIQISRDVWGASKLN